MAASIKLLCVEDEDDLRENLQDYLSLEGYEVDVAENGISAIEHIESDETSYQAIICDINMAGLNGLEFLLTLRRNYNQYQNVPFIFLTGQKDRESQLRANQLGCDHYLSKPVDMELLNTVIRGRLARTDNIKESIQQEQASYQNFLLQSLSDEILEPTNGMITLGMMLRNALTENPTAESRARFEQLQKQATNQLTVIQQMIGLLSHNSISESGFYKRMLSTQALTDYIYKDLILNGFSDTTLTVECQIPESRIQCNTQMIAQMTNALLVPSLFTSTNNRKAGIRCIEKQQGIQLITTDDITMLDHSNRTTVINSHHDLQNSGLRAKHRNVALLYALYVAELHKAELAVTENDNGYIAITMTFTP